jgi:DNA-binding XRE family transcriptional regulator
MLVLGRWLRTWRHSTGATQRQLAALAGIDQAHVSRIEQGKRRPSGVPLARLIIALDWLSGGGDVREGPWAPMWTPPPSHAARWGVVHPPAVIGREPLQVRPTDGAAAILDALLGIRPDAPHTNPAIVAVGLAPEADRAQRRTGDWRRTRRLEADRGSTRSLVTRPHTP